MKTREEIEAMSNEERYLATAIALGWKKEKRKMWGGTPNVAGYGINRHLHRGDKDRGFCATSELWFEFNKYLSGLDAAHELETRIPAAKIGFYSNALTEICGVHPQIPGPTSFVWHATARQRNTAFLMTSGNVPCGSEADGRTSCGQSDAR